jgi:hypothetical protein
MFSLLKFPLNRLLHDERHEIMMILEDRLKNEAVSIFVKYSSISNYDLQDKQKKQRSD